MNYKGFLFLCTLGLCLNCSKDESKMPEPADDLVGHYSYSDSYYLKWGNASKSAVDNGSFSLTKIAADKVRMSGDWNTVGTIVGNTIQFDFCPQKDSKGIYNYTFGVGTISYGTIRFTYSCTGYRTSDAGVSYPWDCNGTIQARKNIGE